MEILDAGMDVDEKKVMRSVQIAASMSSGANILNILEFMLSQLPPHFGKGVELKPATQNSKPAETTEMITTTRETTLFT